MAHDSLPAPRPAGERSPAITRGPVSALTSVPSGPELGAPPSDWGGYVAAFRHHPLVVIAITLIGTLGGAVGARLVHPGYTAKAMLLLEGGEGPGSGEAAGRAIVATVDGPELVQSNAVLDDVVRELRLYLHPRTAADSAALVSFALGPHPHPGVYRLRVDRTAHYALLDENDSLLERGTAGDSIGRVQGFAWKPEAAVLIPGSSVEFRLETPWDAMQRVSKALTVHADPGAHLLRLTLKQSSGVAAATTLNAIADRATAVAADINARRVSELVRLLGEQYDFARSTLASSEEALRQFRSRTAETLQAHAASISPGMDVRGDPAFAHAFDVRLQLDQLRHDRQVIANELARPGAPDDEVNTLSVLPAVQQAAPLRQALADITQKQAEIRALLVRYTKASEPVIEAQAALDTLTGTTVPGLARALIADLTARESTLRPAVDSAGGFLHQVPDLALEEARLGRAVDNASSLASDVRQRYESARLTLASSPPSLSVVDRAVVPRRPDFNLAPLLVVLSCAASFGAGIAGVTLFERLDPKVRRPEQITDAMRLPILGALPRWRGRGAGPDPELIESLRSLRLRLLRAVGVGPPTMLAVTSPESGDGKSFLAVNLALSFAYAGFRTLLVDGDVRGGAQHRVFGMSNQPGLTDVLAGDAPVGRTIRSTGYAYLSLLTAGRRSPRAPELLLSQRLREFATRVGPAYDVIILDTAPLCAGVDAVALAEVAGNLVLVLRSGTTDFAHARSKLGLLEEAQTRLLGVVLNDVGSRDEFRYYTHDLSAYPQVSDSKEDRDRPLGILEGRT